MRGDTKIEIDAYRDSGRVPGGFIQAVLSNDLLQAWDYADANSWADLRNVIHYMNEHLPIASFGDRQKVAAWLLHRGLEGIQERIA